MPAMTATAVGYAAHGFITVTGGTLVSAVITSIAVLITAVHQKKHEAIYLFSVYLPRSAAGFRSAFSPPATERCR